MLSPIRATGPSNFDATGRKVPKNHREKVSLSNQPLFVEAYWAFGGPPTIQPSYTFPERHLYTTIGGKYFPSALPQNITLVQVFECSTTRSTLRKPRWTMTSSDPGSSDRLVSS